MDCLDDDSILAFLDGDIDEARRAAIETHLTGCPPCADLVATGAGGAPEALAHRSLSDALAMDESLVPGATVGRYIILGLVGRGGMGEVYAAYDPQLDRKIALKLLRETGEAGAQSRAAQERLLREAQAIARLSHPNVVVVYDAGAIDDETRGVRVYLAMEFIEGQTLAAWLVAQPRSWRAIRDVFIAAAEGLAAAHAAGLVHRDFKPQNVMVARDGTIRVMDFGLASDRSQVVGGHKPALDWSRPTTGPTTQMLARTGTGALLGTPLYMAPEQFLGRPTDARTDQFSFCVALYEALYHERPFPADDLPTLVNAVVGGRAREPPAKAAVPAFLRRIVVRGLERDPASRFASTRDLITALRADPARRRRSLSIGVGVSALALFVIAGAQRFVNQNARMCLGAADKLAGIWQLESGGARRTALHSAFAATALPYAEDTWTRVSALLDEYSSRWAAAYTDNCDATHVRGDQSAEILDLRMTCLEGGRRALQALTDVLTRADGTTLAEAVNAVNALPPLERCADIPTLRAVTPPPSPAVRARVTELQGRLAEIKALSDTGQWSEGDRQILLLLKDARAVGYQPLLADALIEQALLESDLGNASQGRDASSQALLSALAANRDDLAAESASLLIASNASGFGRLAEATRWAALAQALVRRLGPGHERIAAWVYHDRTFLLDRLADYQGALNAITAAISLKQKVLPPTHPDIARSFELMAILHAKHDNGPSALVAIQRAFEINQAAYGLSNPVMWRTLDARGEIFELLRRYQDAERDLRASVDLAVSLYGFDHHVAAHPLTALGRTLLAEGKVPEAVSTLERALRLRDRAEPNPEYVAETRFALARAYWTANRNRPAALKLARAAREAYRQIPGRKNQADEVDVWLAGKRA